VQDTPGFSPDSGGRLAEMAAIKELTTPAAVRAILAYEKAHSTVTASFPPPRHALRLSHKRSWASAEHAGSARSELGWRCPRAGSVGNPSGIQAFPARATISGGFTDWTVFTLSSSLLIAPSELRPWREFVASRRGGSARQPS
jgi:hypothetical protein